MAIPESFIDELRSRIPMSEVVGKRVQLRRAGRVLQGRCCFHNDRTPSFSVWPDHAHCHGCNWHGDAIAFVMQTEGRDFRDAVARLAAQYGMEVPGEPETDGQRRRRDLVGLLGRQADAWHDGLFRPSGSAALAYLRQRGMTDAMLRQWRIGWADGSLAKADAKDQREAGLLVVGEDGEARGPFFRSQIMFPVSDRRGDVVGFTGRVIGGGHAKYINSPETALFRKRELLYGLAESRALAVDADTLIVEGTFDVIAAQADGLAAVAPLGTALHEEQLKEVWRLADFPVLCFDGDPAGRRATEAAIRLALPHITSEKTLTVAILPAGHDPASLYQRHGPGSLRAVANKAQSLVDAVFALLARDGDRVTPEASAAYRARLEAAAGSIKNKALAGEYKVALLDKYFAWRRSKIAAVDSVLAPEPSETPKARYLRDIQEDIDLAKAQYDASPNEKIAAKLEALCKERDEFAEREFVEDEDVGIHAA